MDLYITGERKDLSSKLKWKTQITSKFDIAKEETKVETRKMKSRTE